MAGGDDMDNKELLPAINVMFAEFRFIKYKLNIFL